MCYLIKSQTRLELTMLNNWQNRASIRKDILACCAQRHSLFGRSVNLFGPLCRRGAAATYKIPKGYSRCFVYFMQLFAGSESENCFCRRNLCSRKHSTKSQVVRIAVEMSREKNAPLQAGRNCGLWIITNAT